MDRYPNPAAKAKVVLHHGVGTNGRQMSLILGAPLAKRGFETVALDNLGYGLTQVRPGSTPSYDDWVDLVVDSLAQEQSRDDRPIVLYGLSAGGMLTYHVAAKAPRGTLRGIVGMTFLDSYATYTPAVEPPAFDACPVLLTQPAEDRWTPHHLSVPVLSRITKVPVETVMLDNAGHYPLEEPGLTQMQDAIADFVTRNTA
ncbi:alpha/beta hydrolase [Streptomyces sp. NPDC057027]|uniref:alpha/beta hydrolase n=1 Tax=Streptomyces sp. NPDC057027 TaxID=3346004 RepID=UPI00363A56D7